MQSTAALLVHTMQESDEPIAALGGALVRIGRTLTDIGVPLGGKPVPGHPPAVQAGLAAIAQEVAVCIESLQFHDRLMQQLAQVGKRLTGVAANEPLPQPPAVSANKGSIELF
jgi:hypothetical protein